MTAVQLGPGTGYLHGTRPRVGWETRWEPPGFHITSLPRSPQAQAGLDLNRVTMLFLLEKEKPLSPVLPQVDDLLVLFGTFYIQVHC